jgi:hypothetical protein
MGDGKMITTELTEGQIKYRVVLDGRTVEVCQWDNGNREVDGNNRSPQWIVVWRREI